jgi:hypothetical protein
MKTSQITIEEVLYGLAFILALTIRLWSLGAKPLSDGEATWALQALSVARGKPLVGGAQPAYILLTGSLFWLFGSTNFVARLLPALAGSLLVLAPSTYRNTFGKSSCLVLAFGLALDPGLVSLSRQAGGPMLALSFLFLTIGLVLSQRWITAGICAGLALLSGADIIQGLLISGLAWIAWRWLPQNIRTPSLEDRTPGFIKGKVDLLPIFTGFIATILLVGTLLLRYPQGLSSWLNSVPVYFYRWVQPSGIPGIRLLAALIIYQPLAILFATIGVLRWGKNLVEATPPSKTVTAGILIALIGISLVLANPGRQMDDLGWVLVIIWAISATELSRSFYLPLNQKIIPAGLAIMVSLLMAIFWLQVASLSNSLPGSSLDFVRPLIVIAIFSLAGLMTWLVASSWSWEFARLGLVWGVMLSMGIYLFAEVSGIVRINPGLQESQRQELWQPFPQIAQADLLVKTLDDLSTWKTGRRDAIDIIVGIDTPSLRWVLRSFTNTSYTEGYQPEALPEMGNQSLPSIFITRQEVQSPSQTAIYRGQDFVWWQKPEWEGILPSNFLRWLLYRKATWQDEQIILWARGDLFPGGSLTPSTDTMPSNQEFDSLLNEQVK